MRIMNNAIPGKNFLYIIVYKALRYLSITIYYTLSITVFIIYADSCMHMYLVVLLPLYIYEIKIIFVFGLSRLAEPFISSSWLHSTPEFKRRVAALSEITASIVAPRLIIWIDSFSMVNDPLAKLWLSEPDHANFIDAIDTSK